MQSILTKKQVKQETAFFTENGRDYKIVANIRYDDECGNGHNSFAITGAIHEKGRNGGYLSEPESCGCIHEDIAKHFPHLAPFIKWHLVSSDYPMHYVANTTYHASNRDYNGLLPGEKRQIKNGKTGLPAWELVVVDKITGEEIPLDKLDKNVDAAEKPDCPYVIDYRPWCTIGEGKTRDFDAARSCAVWPEATEEQLSLPKHELEQLLLARLPALMLEFKADMEKLGFVF